MRYFSFVLRVLFLCIFSGCGDPVGKQLREVERLDAIRSKTAEIISLQKAGIGIEKEKHKSYLDVSETDLMGRANEFKALEKGVAFCHKVVKTKSDPWKKWNTERVEYQKSIDIAVNLIQDQDNNLSYELKTKLLGGLERNQNALRAHKRREPPRLTLEEWGQRCPKLEEDLGIAKRGLESDFEKVKRERDAFWLKIENMEKDLEVTRAALDSINTLHTEAVFTLSKLK